MKSCKLKDAGERAFPVLPLAAWSGFGAVDGNGRKVEVRVRDIALQRLETSEGADHTQVLERHRSEILKIAAEKYERGFIEPDNIILITYEDVAHLE
jgi:Protein of unknown function (DUF1488)